MTSLVAELAGVALIAAGTYLAAGIAAALIVTGALVIVGAQFYGADDEDSADSGPVITVRGEESRWYR